MVDLPKPKRVFVAECEPHIRMSLEARLAFRKDWENLSKGTEIEGSQIIILPPGISLVELTGEGLPKVRVDSEGKLVFLTEGEES